MAFLPGVGLKDVIVGSAFGTGVRHLLIQVTKQGKLLPLADLSILAEENLAHHLQ
jgi:hypothetical protein